MGIVVDFIIVIILALFVLFGYKRGLAGSLIKLLSFVIAIVVAFVLYIPIANSIEKNTQIDDNIKSSIINTLSGNEEENGENNNQEENNLLQDIEQSIAETTQEAKTKIIEKTAEDTTKTVIRVGAWLVVFLCARIILIVVSFFVKGITKIPLIKQVDKIGGIAYGLIEGMLIIYVVLAIISLVSLMWINNGVVTAIQESFIGELLYNNNIIINLFF